MLMLFSGEKIQVPPKWGPKMAVLGKNGGPNLRYWFCDPQKALPSFDVFCVKIGARVSAVAFLKNTPQKIAESLCAEEREIMHAQNQNP